MSRFVNVAAAQMGPISRSETRRDTVRRLIAMMREAKSRGADLVVFCELALTTFFPRWVIEDEAELDSFYEAEMPGPDTAPLFEEAKKLGIGFYLGYAELLRDGGRKRRFNTAILVDKAGRIVGKYRKVHLPGHSEPQPGRTHQHLEKLYFEPGDLGFPVWRTFGGIMGMAICNDRRWPETYRVMGLQGVEMIMLGYNTPLDHTGFADIDGLASFHNHLSMQAGAYQNSTWVVGTAKCGTEEGSKMLGQSVIVAPSGEIVAMAVTLEDEVIATRCDLDLGRRYRETIFDFARHREPESYRLIVERKGAVPPPEGTERPDQPRRAASAG
jgi:predicted amidohydrolase